MLSQAQARRSERFVILATPVVGACRLVLPVQGLTDWTPENVDQQPWSMGRSLHIGRPCLPIGMGEASPGGRGLGQLRQAKRSQYRFADQLVRQYKTKPMPALGPLWREIPNEANAGRR